MHDLTGLVFSRLTVLRKAKNIGREGAWECLCICGKTINRRTNALLSKIRPVKSCGCISREKSRARMTTHGLSNTAEYRAHRSMMNRCYNENVESFSNYGGRGIGVCSRWLGKKGFENFVMDLGLRPAGLSLERKDVNENYSPENCFWANSLTQSKNRRRFVCINNYTDAEFLAEYERRFPTPEYGFSVC